MNNLSWFLYFADVVGEINGAGIIVIFGAIVFSVLCFMRASVDDDFDVVKPYLWRALSTVLVATVLVIFIPNKSTIYAIAASEMGEDAMQSKTGGKALRALNAWLDRQIEGEPEAE